MIRPERICELNDLPAAPGGRFVLYWMQASQRTRFNHALEYAIAEANALGLPVLACFGLMDDYPEANERHYAFMLEGLRDVGAALRKRGVLFVVKRGQPAEVALHYAGKAAAVVCDRGYLRHQRAWRDRLADDAPCRVVQVESDVVVPVEAASDHAEFAARTLRPKISKQLAGWLKPLAPRKVKHPSLKLPVRGDVDWSDTDRALAQLNVDRSVKRVAHFRGGELEAHRRLDRFIDEGLGRYDEARREPAGGATSTLSAYLHFGQISPLDIALRIAAAVRAPKSARDGFLEELIIRRELAVNFVQFTPRYDTYGALPAWARKTLDQHRHDPRPYTYTRRQLESAQTHDPYWNAAQTEMNLTGYMHNSMRMYWGKKILEWKAAPEEAFADTLHLNNKLFLCGRDPNAYANVGWIFGLHDRPWGPARPIFGTVRYMNSAGLDRKFDMQAYLSRVESLA